MVRDASGLRSTSRMPDGAQAVRAHRPGVAGHQDHGQVGTDLAQLRRQRRAGHPRHHLVGEHEVEAAGISAEGRQRPGGAVEPDRLVAERREHLLPEQHQRLFVVHEQHGLAAAAGDRRTPWRVPRRRPAAPRPAAGRPRRCCPLRGGCAGAGRRRGRRRRHATVARPRPVPPPGSLVVKKGSKMRSAVAASMPWPVSATARRT